MSEVTEEMVEAAARATCALDNADPDEIMPDGLPRWCDRAEHSRVAIAAALQAAHAEAEALRKEVERLTGERQELLDMVGNLSGSLNLTRDYNPEQTVGAFYERVPYCKMASDMAHRFCEADFAREEAALERKP